MLFFFEQIFTNLSVLLLCSELDTTGLEHTPNNSNLDTSLLSFGNTKHFNRSTSNPDLSPSSISSRSISASINNQYQDDDQLAFVVKVYRSDQTFKYFPVHKETTAKQLVMLALTEFGIIDPSR